MNNTVSLIAMIVSDLLIVGLYIFIRKQKKTQLVKVFNGMLAFMFIWTTSMIMQTLFQNTNVDPFLFEKISALGAFPISVMVLLLGLVFSNTKMKFKWYHSLLFLIPVISIIMVETNDYHHLFIVEYSIKSKEAIVRTILYSAFNIFLCLPIYRNTLLSNI